MLEARYNRALCLVRLGRAAEARAALQPFADGTLAHYRADEARALVQSLGRAYTSGFTLNDRFTGPIQKPMPTIRAIPIHM